MGRVGWTVCLHNTPARHAPSGAHGAQLLRRFLRLQPCAPAYEEVRRYVRRALRRHGRSLRARRARAGDPRNSALRSRLPPRVLPGSDEPLGWLAARTSASPKAPSPPRKPAGIDAERLRWQACAALDGFFARPEPVPDHIAAEWWIADLIADPDVGRVPELALPARGRPGGGGPRGAAQGDQACGHPDRAAADGGGLVGRERICACSPRQRIRWRVPAYEASAAAVALDCRRRASPRGFRTRASPTSCARPSQTLRTVRRQRLPCGHCGRADFRGSRSTTTATLRSARSSGYAMRSPCWRRRHDAFLGKVRARHRRRRRHRRCDCGAIGVRGCGGRRARPPGRGGGGYGATDRGRRREGARAHRPRSPNPDSVAAALAEMEEAIGAPDVLVNNAALGDQGRSGEHRALPTGKPRSRSISTASSSAPRRFCPAWSRRAPAPSSTSARSTA